jgi:hypothetical protein
MYHAKKVKAKLSTISADEYAHAVAAFGAGC